MNYLYVTSFTERMYNVSAKNLINSFIENGINGHLLLCHENMDFNIDNSKIFTYELSSNPFLKTWLEKYKDYIPTKFGGNAIKTLDNANTISQYNYKSSLWFRKVASLNYALTQYGYQFSHIIWIDSDCVFTNYIPDLHMKNVLGDYGVSYLLGPLRSLFDYSKDFAGFGVESSFMSFSKNNNGYLFLNQLFDFYQSGKFLQLSRWDDGYIIKHLIVQNEDNIYKANYVKTHDLVQTNRIQFQHNLLPIIKSIKTESSLKLNRHIVKQMAKKMGYTSNVYNKTLLHNYIEHRKGTHRRLKKYVFGGYSTKKSHSKRKKQTRRKKLRKR